MVHYRVTRFTCAIHVQVVYLLTMKLSPTILYLLSCLCLAQKDKFFGGPRRRPTMMPPTRGNMVYLCECSGKNETAITCNEKLLMRNKARKIAKNPKRTATIGRCSQTKFLVCRCRNGGDNEVRTCKTKKVAALNIPTQVKKRRVTLGACAQSNGNGTVITNTTKTNTTNSSSRFF